MILLDDVDDWFMDLARRDPASAELVAGALDLLEWEGLTLGRPAIDRIKSSRHQNVKELRPGSTGGTEVRILFVFDPRRQAILLIAGDKTGAWKQRHHQNVPLAERRYDDWLDAQDKEV